MPPWATITVLGSGGVVPTRERLTPSFLVYDWQGAGVLLDAGEGVQRRIRGSERSIHDIDVIALTHEHGDHVNGLAGLLQSMAVERRKRPLTIVGNRRTIDFVEETLEATSGRLGFEVQTVVAEGRGSATIYRRGGDTLTLEWFPVCHTPGALGYRLEWRLRARVSRARLEALGLRPGPWLSRLMESGRVEVGGVVVRRDQVVEGGGSYTIVYSGDTAPCKTVLEAARGAGILIHEATYTSDMAEEALERGHSASVHAAKIAAMAGTGLLVLFHYSPRYGGDGVRRIILEASRIHGNVVGAWDGMRMRLHLSP